MHASRPSAPLGLSVAAAMLAGVCVVQVLPRLPAIGISVCLCALGLAGAVLGRRWRLPGALLCGLGWAAACAAAQLAAGIAVAPSADVRLVGRIVDLPRVTATASHFDLAVESASLPHLAGHTVRLAWYGRAPALPPGSRWRLEAHLRPPASQRTPGSFDPARQALALGRVAEGYVRPASSRRPLAAGQGIDAWRERVARNLDATLPDGRARFVRALAIGDTRGLDPEDWFVLRATGLTHQIAISGFHVGMVAGLGALLVRGGYWLLPWFARRLPRPQAAAIGALALAGYYAAVAGFSLPTVRTLLMIAVALGARLWRRRLGAADALALALIAVLVASPLAVLAPGFWLSFAGVAWLLWCLPRGGDDGLLWPFAKAQAVAVVGLLPLTVWFFGQASLLGPVANLVGIPVISLGVVPLSLLGLLLHAAWPVAGEACWQLSSGLMDLLWHALAWASRSPWALWWLPTPDTTNLVLGLVGAFWWLLPRGIPGKTFAPCLLLPLLWPRPDLPPAGAADLAVFDVGKGDAVLVRTAGHALLVDTGPAAGNADTTGIVAALQALGVRDLDAVLISHGDAGRTGGLAAVRRQFPGAQIVAPDGWAAPGDTRCRTGARWRWDDIDFEFLHPPPDFPPLRGENSCVLRIGSTQHAALLPGEIGPVVQRHLAASLAARLRADWLLAPRHARRSATDPDFLAQVAPTWVVASTAMPGRRGSADPEVLAGFARGGSRVLTTAEQGSLRFRLDASGVRRLEPGPGAGDRYWRAARRCRIRRRSGYAIGHLPLSPQGEACWN